MPSPDEIQRIATAMNALRPDWRYTSLVTFLTNHHAARPYRDLAIAAVAVATDARTTTPNLLNEHGPWWVASQTAAGTAAKSTMAGVPAPGTPRCQMHEHELAANCRSCAVERFDPTDVPTLALSPAQVARNARGARLVRDAIAGRATHTPAGPDAQSLAAHDAEVLAVQRDVLAEQVAEVLHENLYPAPSITWADRKAAAHNYPDGYDAEAVRQCQTLAAAVVAAIYGARP